MSNEAIGHALRIVASHGFKALAIDGGVTIEMPYSSADGNGTMWIECYSHREVFATLGY